MRPENLSNLKGDKANVIELLEGSAGGGQIRVSMKACETKGISRCFWNCQFPSECGS